MVKWLKQTCSIVIEQVMLCTWCVFFYSKGNSKFIPVHVMNTASLGVQLHVYSTSVMNADGSQIHVSVASYPRKRALETITQTAECAPWLVWTTGEEKITYPWRKSNPRSSSE
jgi:hypothetical protein